MAQGTFNRGKFEDPSNVQTISVKFDDATWPAGAPSTRTDCPVMKFPANGRVTGARFIPHVAIGAGTVNYQVGVRNGGQGALPSGTIQPFAQSTAGTLTANWPIELVLDPVNDKDLFATGDWVVADCTLAGDPNVNFTLQVDYIVYGF